MAKQAEEKENCDVLWDKIVEILSTYYKIFLLRHNH